MPSPRPARQAGRFYPESRRSCEAALADLFADRATQPAVGAVVPHAGWVFSGALAATGVAAIAAAAPETVVIFGAVHRPLRPAAAIYPDGSWMTPLGEALIDADLAADLAASDLIAADFAAHADEHSIEVEVPLIQCALPEARILPIMVNPSDAAVHIGAEVAAAVERSGRRVGYLASTDLTHYGPRFGFTPAGVGPEGVRWAKEVNDRRFIDLITSRAADKLVAEAGEHRNACGPGAVASLLGAIAAAGFAGEYREIEHANSIDTRPDLAGDQTDSVGYEVGIFPAN